MRKLARPGVRVDEIKVTGLQSTEKVRAIGQVKTHARILSEVASSHGQYLSIAVDRFKASMGIHTGKDPRRTETGSGAEFEYRATGLRGRQGSQQRPGPGAPPGYLPVPKDRIQPKYNTQTTLTAEVKAEGQNTFNFEVN